MASASNRAALEAAIAAQMEAIVDDSSIQTAAGDGHLDRVKSLVAKGASVNAQDEYGYSPLHAACSYGNVEVARWLLEQGASVALRDADGDTPLSVCEDPGCADLLIAAGADLLSMNTEGATAYHLAVWDCREDMVEWLKAQYAQRGLALPEVGEAPGEEDEDDDGGDDDGLAEEAEGEDP